jgi:flagellar hook-associated protein 2
MTITFSGLGSGLDTTAIINAILQVEALPMQKLQGEKAVNTKKLDLIGTLKGLVDDLKKKANEFSDLGGFLAYTVTNDESVAAFTLTGDTAATGGHTLEILSLASADRYTFDPMATVTDPAVDLGAGTMHFTYGENTYDVAIGAGAGESSLNAIAMAINTEAGEDVTASVINTGTELSPDYQLVMTGNDTGSDFVIGELGQSTVPGLTGMTLLQIGEASNAVAVVDGLTVERSDNVFAGVVEGLSFTATGTTQGVSTFSVEVNNEGVTEHVQGFVDAYNAVMSFIETQNEFDKEEGAKSYLFGDSILSRVRSTINAALFNVDIGTVVADTEGYSTLGLIGIDLQADGSLKLDATQFEDKLTGNLDALSSLFADEDTGLMVKLETAIDEMVDSQTSQSGAAIPGIFDLRTETLQSLNKTIDKQLASLEFNLGQIEETLKQKFASLEKLMAGLNSQGDYLQAQLDSLSS